MFLVPLDNITDGKKINMILGKDCKCIWFSIFLFLFLISMEKNTYTSSMAKYHIPQAMLTYLSKDNTPAIAAVSLWRSTIIFQAPTKFCYGQTHNLNGNKIGNTTIICFRSEMLSMIFIVTSRMWYHFYLISFNIVYSYFDEMKKFSEFFTCLSSL